MGSNTDDLGSEVPQENDKERQQPVVDRRQHNFGPPSHIGERRSDEIEHIEVKKIIEERKIAEAVNRARLETMAVKDNRTRQMTTWLSLLISLIAIALPQYNSSQNEDKAKDILSSLGVSGEQLKRDILAAQEKHKVYESQIEDAKNNIFKLTQEIEVRHVKIDGSFNSIDTKIHEAVIAIRELQITITKLSNELAKQETLITVLQEQLRIRRTDYAGSPQ